MAESEESSPERLGDIVQGFMKDGLSKGLSANQRAAAAWYGANGDIERAHTTGVYLRKSSVKGAKPVLCVYVDSHTRMMDFTVNREVYLLRLANYGYEVSGIEFKLSRRPKREAQPSAGDVAAPKDKPPLPELSAEEEAEVGRLTESVAPELRDKVGKAVEFSFRRQKSLTTNSHETRQK